MTAQPACTVPAPFPLLPPRVHLPLVGAAAAFCLTPYASPGLALALGLALAFFGIQAPAPLLKSTRPLLQTSVILLGFGMNLHTLLAAARQGFLLSLATILLTFALGALLARLLTIPRPIATLISAGTAICGGSAIAATALSIGAAEAEISVAMAVIFLLNAAALYLFPLLGHALHLSPTQFGTWSGIAIHDVSSVVGAASVFGQASLPTATAVKLSRTLWIIPVSLLAGHALRAGAPGAPRITLPWFILPFLLASLATSFLPLVAPFTPTLLHLAHTGMTLTLFLIGLTLSRASLQKTGLRPLLLALALWFAIAASSLLFLTAT